MPKGPLDRLAELRKKAAALHSQIANGESGDGLIKPDLRAQLEMVEGELRNLEVANRMFPAMGGGTELTDLMGAAGMKRP